MTEPRNGDKVTSRELYESIDRLRREVSTARHDQNNKFTTAFYNLQTNLERRIERLDEKLEKSFNDLKEEHERDQDIQQQTIDRISKQLFIFAGGIGTLIFLVQLVLPFLRDYLNKF